MEDTVIVIMLKDKTTGFLEKELGSYTLQEGGSMIYNIYAEEREDGAKAVVLRLTCDRPILDWEYDAIFDYYDMEPMEALGYKMAEEDGQFDPLWVVEFPFVDRYEEMENALATMLTTHKNELISVYEVIADKEDDYIEEE